MRRVTATLMLPVLLAAMTTPAEAGEDWKTTISKERVVISDGKMKMEEFQLCKVKGAPSGNNSFQMRSYTEAPNNAGISRDFMVSFGTVMQTATVLMFGVAMNKAGADNPFDALDCSPLTAPIGTADLEVNLYMTSEGFQMEFVDSSTGKKTRTSDTWANTFDGK